MMYSPFWKEGFFTLLALGIFFAGCMVGWETRSQRIRTTLNHEFDVGGKWYICQEKP